jgi:hypothetical protein
MLHNPAYAGASVRGRYGGHAEPMPSGEPRRGPLEPATQLETVCVPNVYPASLSRETSRANGTR